MPLVALGTGEVRISREVRKGPLASLGPTVSGLTYDAGKGTPLPPPCHDAHSGAPIPLL